MMRALLGVLVLWGGFGCTAIHSYNAARDFNPKAISVSGTLGTGVTLRDRDGDGKTDGFEREKTLVPDAKANIRLHANDFLSFGIDPLPPSVGVNLSWRYYPQDDRKASLTIEPSFNYLVYPLQKIYSVELPVTAAFKVRKWLVIYAGPKAVYQSGVLIPVTRGLPQLWMGKVVNRPEQDFKFVGGFVGVAVGWLHLQVNPEIDYYYDIQGTGEQVILAGVGVRLAL